MASETQTLIKQFYTSREEEMSKSKMKKFLTGQKVSDLLDQISQILIALVHFFFGSIGFQQDILSILFGLICPQFCFRDLHMKNKLSREQFHSF